MSMRPQLLHSRRSASTLLAMAAGCAVVSDVWAQPAPLPSREVPVGIDSAFVQNDAPGPALEADPSLIFSTEVHIADAEWLRLDLTETQLAGDPEAGTGSFLIITAAADSASQRLDGATLEHWNETSAYFNGDRLEIELWAYPQTGMNRVSIPVATVGEPDDVESICDGEDDRTPFNDPRVARLLPASCTAWLITRDGGANRFLTAGHCISTGTSDGVVHFNVPLASSTGVARHPPPEYQYPIQQSSIQVVDSGVGDDAATFQTFPNSETGLMPRVAQRSAYVLASSAPGAAEQTLTLTGHGRRDAAAPIPHEWSRIQKIDTGPYTSKSGTTIRHRVDTTPGNSGSPITMMMLVGFPLPIFVERAIGIHSHGGCTSTGGSNAGTAIEHPDLQNFLDNPQGTIVPYTAPECLTTLIDADNQGAAGGAVYFDVEVGSEPIEVWGLDLNIRNGAEPGGRYTAEVYLTPNSHVGKENSPSAWTLVGTGIGLVTPRDERSRLILEHPIRLAHGVRYGIAIVLDENDAGHAYTDGDGTNEVHTGDHLTIEAGAATNEPFSGAVFSPRVFNGQLCYNVLPEEGQCMETFYATNNQGSVGGAVYFDLEIVADRAVRTTQMNINTTATAGTSLSMDIYRHPETSFGNQTSGNWELIGSASGSSAGPDEPTVMMVDAPIFFEGESSQGIALVLHDGAHAYTNGTGFNEVHQNSAMRITAGSASNTPFSGTIFEPRVFNGGFCYVLGTGSCDPEGTLESQSPPDQGLVSRSSNTVGQQIADDFEFAQQMDIDAMKLWAVYGNGLTVPAEQDFVINIYDHDPATGDPGTLLYSERVSGITPVPTGLGRLSGPNREIHEFHIDLPVPFTADGNTRYWLSPLGDTEGIVWAWQFSSDTGTRRSRSEPTASWSTFSGELAWELCGTESCYANCDGSTSEPILTVDDFTCFINEFAEAQGLPVAQQITHYANCDGSTTEPILTVDDFTCFINAFAQGCP